MIFKLPNSKYHLIQSLVSDIEFNPVINGVIDGNNLGNVYVNDQDIPTSALVWAKNEMFYLIGNADNNEFNSGLENYIINYIIPEALQIGDVHLNLEAYPYFEWERAIKEIFSVPLNIGERVPFTFDKERFLQSTEKRMDVSKEYQLLEINRSLFVNSFDKEDIIKNEVLKFWETLDQFFEKGLGYCVLHQGKVIGSCVSVFSSNDHYEIGINTYCKEHRGKGLATAMATAFITKCLNNGGIPHWSTESFRMDSIVTAEKLGFERKANYKVHHLSFIELTK